MFKGSGDSKAKADKGREGGIKPVGVEFGLPTLLDTDGPIAKEVMSLLFCVWRRCGLILLDDAHLKTVM